METFLFLLCAVKEKRDIFLSGVHFHQGDKHEMSRNNVFEDVLRLYRNNPRTMTEYPFKVSFKEELAIDLGGVSRDLFSAFWEKAYIQAFDGCSTFIPQTHPHIDISMYPVLGTIISHGFLVTGVLPVRLAFPVIAATVLDPTVTIPDSTFILSLIDYISPYEADILKRAFTVNITSVSFPRVLLDDLISMLSRLGCRQVPTPENIKRLVIDVSKHEFLSRPIFAMQSGIPVPHFSFWKQFSVEELYGIYKELQATAASVIRNIKAPETMNSAQEVVMSFLIRMLGGMKQDELSNFLRYVTGSCVPLEEPIKVSFNSLSGLARRPIAHMCACRLELSTTYITFIEFETEFKSVLNSEYAWIMDSV